MIGILLWLVASSAESDFNMTTQLDMILGELGEMLRNPPTTVEGFRAGWDGLMEKVIAGIDPVADVKRENVSVAGVPGVWFDAPAAEPGRVILFLHGGGYAFGSVETHRDLIARLAVAGRAHVLAVDYALAPEGPFPAGINDVVTAYRWIVDEGFDPDCVAIVGDSAGGGAALAALVRIVADADLPNPAAAVAISPWLDFEALGASMDTNAAADPFNNREVVLLVAQMYLQGASARDASPLYADLTGLPPLLLIAGGDEVLVDDTRRFAAAARSHGVTVCEKVYNGLYHDFPLFEPTASPGRNAFAQIGEHLEAHL